MIRLLAWTEAYIDFEADEVSDPRLKGTFHEVSIGVKTLAEVI